MCCQLTVIPLFKLSVSVVDDFENLLKINNNNHKLTVKNSP